MATTEDPMKRALDAVERRFALEAQAQNKRKPNQRILYKQTPAMKHAPVSSASVERPREMSLLVQKTSINAAQNKKPDKRRRHEQDPDSEKDEFPYSLICQPVHENLLTALEVPIDKKSTVDKVLYGLLRKGDSAQKYIQGSKSVKLDHAVQLDNYVQGNKTYVASLQSLKAISKRSKNHMSMKQLKKHGLYELPEESHKFELLMPAHEIWKQYIMQLLKNIGKNQVAAVLFGADLHGAIIRVAECKINSFLGVFGIMIRESEETFGIVTQDNKFRVVPKRGSVFALQADCWRTTLLGDKYIARKLGS